uniref:Uncharacterized protein n=1 Tax=Mycena chlorophos TaxID=658473 RepID=A0ABQ0LPF1_MYCCL|nr:predicted protein [Mycena chlorophos]
MPESRHVPSSAPSTSISPITKLRCFEKHQNPHQQTTSSKSLCTPQHKHQEDKRPAPTPTTTHVLRLSPNSLEMRLELVSVFLLLLATHTTLATPKKCAICKPELESSDGKEYRLVKSGVSDDGSTTFCPYEEERDDKDGEKEQGFCSYYNNNGTEVEQSGDAELKCCPAQVHLKDC